MREGRKEEVGREAEAAAWLPSSLDGREGLRGMPGDREGRQRGWRGRGAAKTRDPGGVRRVRHEKHGPRTWPPIRERARAGHRFREGEEGVSDLRFREGGRVYPTGDRPLRGACTDRPRTNETASHSSLITALGDLNSHLLLVSHGSSS